MRDKRNAEHTGRDRLADAFSTCVVTEVQLTVEEWTSGTLKRRTPRRVGRPHSSKFALSLGLPMEVCRARQRPLTSERLSPLSVRALRGHAGFIASLPGQSAKNPH